MWEQIIRKAFESEDPIIVNELIKDSNYKVKGNESLDLYIYTDKQYLVQKFKSNIINIREYTSKSEGKHINKIFINNVKYEVKIEKLNSKHDINIIDINSLDVGSDNDLSGENDIISTLFEYEESVLQKQRVTLHLHQRESKKEFVQEINMSIVSKAHDHAVDNWTLGILFMSSSMVFLHLRPKARVTHLEGNSIITSHNISHFCFFAVLLFIKMMGVIGTACILGF